MIVFILEFKTNEDANIYIDEYDTGLLTARIHGSRTHVH